MKREGIRSICILLSVIDKDLEKESYNSLLHKKTLIGGRRVVPKDSAKIADKCK